MSPPGESQQPVFLVLKMQLVAHVFKTREIFCTISGARQRRFVLNMSVNFTFID